MAISDLSATYRNAQPGQEIWCLHRVERGVFEGLSRRSTRIAWRQRCRKIDPHQGIVRRFPATDGEILVDGEVVKFASPRNATEAGIGTVYQDLALNPLSSVTRNFFSSPAIARAIYVGAKVASFLMSRLRRLARRSRWKS